MHEVLGDTLRLKPIDPAGLTQQREGKFTFFSDMEVNGGKRLMMIQKY